MPYVQMNFVFVKAVTAFCHKLFFFLDIFIIPLFAPFSAFCKSRKQRLPWLQGTYQTEMGLPLRGKKLPLQAMSTIRDVSRIWLNHSSEHFKKSRLSRPIGADQTYLLPFCNF